jgi:hypothetical protein
MANAKQVSSRDQLIANLLNGSAPQQEQGRSFGEWLEDVATDAAATTLSGTAKVGGALMSAVDNAKQSFKLERNFRSAEISVKAQRQAERYADRLLMLSK